MTDRINQTGETAGDVCRLCKTHVTDLKPGIYLQRVNEISECRPACRTPGKEHAVIAAINGRLRQMSETPLPEMFPTIARLADPANTTVGYQALALIEEAARCYRLLQSLRQSHAETAARAESRVESLELALTDSLELLNGWISRYCVPKYKQEHYAHLDKLHTILRGHAIDDRRTVLVKAIDLLKRFVGLVPEPELIHSLDEPPQHRTQEDHELGYALQLSRELIKSAALAAEQEVRT